MKTSRIRPPAEIGFLSCEETVSSCVVVQNAALPNVLISVCPVWRSTRNAANRRTGQHRRSPRLSSRGGRAAADAWASPRAGRHAARRQRTPALETASINRRGRAGRQSIYASVRSPRFTRRSDRRTRARPPTRAKASTAAVSRRPSSWIASLRRSIDASLLAIAIRAIARKQTLEPLESVAAAPGSRARALGRRPNSRGPDSHQLIPISRARSTDATSSRSLMVSSLISIF